MRTYQFDKKGSEIQELLDQIKNKTIYGNATKDSAGLMSAEDKDTLDTLVDNVGENIQQLNNLNQAVSENATTIETNTSNIATNTSDINALNTATGNLGTRLDAAEETLDNIFQLDANNFMGIYDAAANLPAMTGAGWALVGQNLTALLAYVYNIPQAQWQQYGTTTYDYSDYSGLATQVATIGSKIGDLANLQTTDKSSLVNALNEVNEKFNDISTDAESISYKDTHSIGADNIQAAIDILSSNVLSWEDIAEGEVFEYKEPLAIESLSLAVASASTVFYDSMTLDTIKANLVLTAIYNDGTSATVPSSSYTLTGTVKVGEQVFTATYSGIKTSITLNIAERSSVVTGLTASSSVQSVSMYTDTDDLKQYLTVYKVYGDGATELASVDEYTLSGEMTEGPSTITVYYAEDEGVSTTFTITGINDGSYVEDSLYLMFNANDYSNEDFADADTSVAQTVTDSSGNELPINIGYLAALINKGTQAGFLEGTKGKYFFINRVNIGAVTRYIALTASSVSGMAYPLTFEIYGLVRGTTDITSLTSVIDICLFKNGSTSIMRNCFSGRGTQLAIIGQVSTPNLKFDASYPYNDTNHTDVFTLTHMAFVMESSAQRVYVNGTEIYSGTSKMAAGITGVTNIVLSQWGSEMFDVCMVRVYKSALNAKEVVRNYNNCKSIWGTTR